MVLPLFGGQIENVIQGSPDSRRRRKGESPVVKASVEMEEQIVNLEIAHASILQDLRKNFTGRVQLYFKGGGWVAH